jgi:hypothetical protein
LLSLRIEACRTAGRVVRTDPAGVVSAVHAWLGAIPHWTPPVSLVCDFGPVAVQVEVTPAESADLGYEL